MNTAIWNFTLRAWMLTLFGLLLCGCDLRQSPTTREWTEDVLLEDGTTIVVKRTVSFKETNSWSGDAYNAVETDATISFTGELASLQPWRAPLMALVMYRDKEAMEWVVVAISSSCEVWNRRGRPRPPYWEFRLDAGGWRETPLSQSSIGRSGNLLHRYQADLKTTHITVEGRKEREVPGRPFNAMSPTEKKYWTVMSEVNPYNC